MLRHDGSTEICCTTISKLSSILKPMAPMFFSSSLHKYKCQLGLVLYACIVCCKCLTSFSFGIKDRSEEHTSELQSRFDLVCRLLLEKKKTVFTIHADGIIL